MNEVEEENLSSSSNHSSSSFTSGVASDASGGGVSMGKYKNKEVSILWRREKSARDDLEDDDHGVVLSEPQTRNIDGVEMTFMQAVNAAMSRGCELVLEEGCTVFIGSDTIKVSKKRQTLTIRGEGLSGATIVGCGHSVIVVEGKATKIVLENLNIYHDCQRSNKRDVGAVVYGRNSGNALVRRCVLVSSQGFSVWGVQKATIDLSGCFIRSISRSGCVLFCDVKVSISASVIWGCKLHGICMRARASLKLVDSLIARCGKRGVYAYHNVKVDMIRCIITGIGTDTCTSANSLPASSSEEKYLVDKDELYEINLSILYSRCESKVECENAYKEDKILTFLKPTTYSSFFSTKNFFEEYHEEGFALVDVDQTTAVLPTSAALDINGRDEDPDFDVDNEDDNKEKVEEKVVVGDTVSNNKIDINVGDINESNSKNGKFSSENSKRIGSSNRNKSVVDGSKNQDDPLYISIEDCRIIDNLTPDFSFSGRIRGRLSNCMFQRKPCNPILNETFVSFPDGRMEHNCDDYINTNSSGENCTSSGTTPPFIVVNIESKQDILKQLFCTSCDAKEPQFSPDLVASKSSLLSSIMLSTNKIVSISWEYQCDDSESKTDVKSLLSGRLDWRVFDSISADILEMKYRAYIAFVECGIKAGGVAVEDYGEDDDDDDDDDDIEVENLVIKSAIDDVTSFDLEVRGENYKINFRYMTQTNPHTFYSRSIRRIVT